MAVIGLILLLPLAASVLAVLFPLKRFHHGMLVLIATAASFTLTWFARDTSLQTSWLQSGALNLPLFFHVEDVQLVRIITGISGLVQFYSLFYLSSSANHRSYFSLLGFFTFAMLGLATSTHLLVTFVFWELVGYTSYRLIGFDTTTSSTSSALKALLINKVGDVCFLIGILMLASTGLLSTSNLVPESAGTLPLLLIFVGVVAKSAQAPLFPWLTAAMAGPTPVSALLHSATMVAAGVLVLLRLVPLLNDTVSTMISFTGGVTLLLGGLLAIFSYDIKRILAYSTISQLGLMVLAIGAGAHASGYLHLQTHAIFKAGLFLCAGVFIHHGVISGHPNPNDIRHFSNPNGWLKWSWVILSGSLVGLPLTAGFLSKEAILHDVMTFSASLSLFVWVSIPLTALYVGRVSYFLVSKKTESSPLHALLLPALLLSLVSVTWFVAAIQSDAPTAWVSIAVSQTLVIGGLFAGFRLAKISFSEKSWHTNLGLDGLYDKKMPQLATAWGRAGIAVDRQIIDRLVHAWAYNTVLFAHLTSWFDRAIVDLTLVGGSSWVVRFTGQLVRVPMSGKVQGYLLWALFSLFLFLVLWLLL